MNYFIVFNALVSRSFDPIVHNNYVPEFLTFSWWNNSQGPSSLLVYAASMAKEWVPCMDPTQGVSLIPELSRKKITNNKTKN